MKETAFLSSRLIAIDTHGSILSQHANQQSKTLSYTPFGYDPSEPTDSTQLRFNTQLRESTCKYILGNGYRTYNPLLMIFNTPDNLSPFDKGGLNTYAYCANDPVNYIDPTGHIRNKKMLLGQAYHLAVENALPISALKKEFSEKTKILETHKQDLLNYSYNHPRKLEAYHNLRTSTRYAESRQERHTIPTENSILPQPNSNFRLMTEASTAKGGLKHFTNTHPNIERMSNLPAEIKRLENELATITKKLSSIQDNNQENRSST